MTKEEAFDRIAAAVRACTDTARYKTGAKSVNLWLFVTPKDFEALNMLLGAKSFHKEENHEAGS